MQQVLPIQHSTVRELQLPKHVGSLREQEMADVVAGINIQQPPGHPGSNCLVHLMELQHLRGLAQLPGGPVDQQRRAAIQVVAAPMGSAHPVGRDKLPDA